MVDKRKRNVTIILVVLAFLMLGGILATQNQAFSLVSSPVWIPQYYTAECLPVEGTNLNLRTNLPHTDDPTWYHCNSAESLTYIPTGPGIGQASAPQCEYVFSQFSTATIQRCGGFTENTDDLKDRTKCTADLTSTSGDTQEFKVNAGDSLYVNTNSFGVANRDTAYPAYGLRVRQADGFVSREVTTCAINNFPTGQFHTLDSNDVIVLDTENRLVVPLNVPLNAVSGSVLAKSSQAVTLQDVEGGAPIYITRPGHYNLIREAEDGYLYVDTKREFSSNQIECIPRTTGCNDEAKIIPLAQQSCDSNAGTLVGYNPVEGDSTKLCTYECSGGQTSVTNDCITVPESCPNKAPLFDINTGKCVAVVTPPDSNNTQDLTLILIALGFLTVIVIMVGVAVSRKGNRKGGSLLGY